MQKYLLLGINQIFLFTLTMPFNVISCVSYLTLILNPLTNLCFILRQFFTYCELSMILKTSLFRVITQQKQ